MHIGALKLFTDVVRLRSFSRCAAENDVTQSTASQAVHSLEERLGVTLIDRSQRPWKLTPEGETFYHGCRDLVGQYEELERRVKGVNRLVGSVVRVASIYSVGLRHMKQYAQTFESQNPSSKVHLEYLHPNRIYESVLNGETDIGILSFPQARRGVAVLPWRTEPMALVCSPDHRFAREKEVRAADLNGEKFVGFDKDLVIRAEIDRFLRRHGAEVDVVLEFDNIESIKRAVEIASGISIVPRPTLDREIASGTLAAAALTEKFERPLGIIHRRGRKFSSAVEKFVELIKREDPVRGGKRPHARAA